MIAAKNARLFIRVPFACAMVINRFLMGQAISSPFDGVKFFLTSRKGYICLRFSLHVYFFFVENLSIRLDDNSNAQMVLYD